MTNQEKNEAVARKLGFEIMWVDDDTLAPYVLVYKKILGDGFMLPDYCDDIKAAWEMVPKFENFELKDMGGYWGVFAKGLKSSEYADTVPLVIVNAFLKMP